MTKQNFFQAVSSPRAAYLVLRLGLGFAFLYPPIDAIFDSASWVGYLPHFIRGFVPDLVLLHAFGVLEIVIALWILSGKKIRTPSALACVILLVIVCLNLDQFEIVFRDLSIAAIALALTIQPDVARVLPLSTSEVSE